MKVTYLEEEKIARPGFEERGGKLISRMRVLYTPKAQELEGLQLQLLRMHLGRPGNQHPKWQSQKRHHCQDLVMENVNIAGGVACPQID